MSAYVPPPPPMPQRSSDSCFKWGAVGCGGCLVLLIAGGILIYMTAGKFIGGAMRDSVQVSLEMHTLWQQIKRYQADSGKYPDKLEDLVPKYIPSAARLKLSTHPDGPQYTYYKPGPNAQPDDVMLEYTLTIRAPDGEKVEVPVRMQINGGTQQGSTRVTPGTRRSRSSPPGRPATSSGD